MAKPTDQQIDTAIMYLENNEGDDYEKAACVAVAGWLEKQQADAYLRKEAKKAGIPLSRVRDRLKTLQNTPK